MRVRNTEMLRRGIRLLLIVISLYLIVSLSYSVFKFSFRLNSSTNSDVKLLKLRELVKPEGSVYYKDKLQRNKVVRCLIAEPTLHSDEVLNGTKFTHNGSTCGTCATDLTNKTFIKLDVNYNIERVFSFDSIPYNEHSGKTYAVVQNKDGIPKNLHFIWNNNFIPDPFVKNLIKFRELHPDWRIYFWTLQRGREFIQKYEPSILSTYDRYLLNVSRADALRYVVLYHFGGAYFDLDCEPRITLDNLLKTGECLVGPEPMENAVFVMGMRSLLSNAAFLCKARHAFFRQLIDSIPSMKHVKDISTSTGPIYMTRQLNSYLINEFNNQCSIEHTRPTDIKIVKHDFFEFTPKQKVLKSMVSKHCKTVMNIVESYLKECYHNQNDQRRCSDLRPNNNQTDINIFDACLEWVLHGGTNRTTHSVRYVNHVHYGTYNSNAVFTLKSVNISQIIPGVIEFDVFSH